MPTMILKCGCGHAYQENAYGPSMRAMNQVATPSGQKKKWRCSVCLKEQEHGGEKSEKEIKAEEKKQKKENKGK